MTNLPKQLSGIQFASEIDYTHGAINGLFNLQNYYELQSDDIAEGYILDGEREVERKGEISGEDCVEIAGQARRMNQLHLAVEWLRTSLSRSEALSPDKVAERRKLLKKAQVEILVTRGLV